MSNERFPVAIIGAGNIGTDLMIKILRGEGPLQVGAMIGIDPTSDGLARAERLGCRHLRMASTDCRRCPASAISGWCSTPPLPARTRDTGSCCAITDTRHRPHPEAIGPFCVPVVNLNDHIDAPNLNMVTCGGQATAPIVAAVNESAPVSYAETRRRSRRNGRPGHPGQHRRVHRNDCGGTESRRRRTTEQGGDHPQPGRSANPDA